jgi:hypothetical protein
MYIMDYSDNVKGLVDPGQELWIDDIKQLMINTSLPNETFVQYRDDDGGVFRLVVKDGVIKEISPQWGKAYAVPQTHWDDAGYQTEVNVFIVQAEDAEIALLLIKGDREVNQHGHYEYDDVVELSRDEGIQRIYHSDN